jgi:CBS domain-containing protein
LRSTTPQALLNSTIYFDFRPIYGEESLGDELHAWLRKHIPDSTLFLRFMAQDALRAQPPLGMLRDFSFDDNKDFPRTIDLKTQGSRLFVDAARILALSCGVDETGTPARLRAAAERGKFGRDDVSAVIDGFFFIQQLRLRQQQSGTPMGMANRVDPEELNELDRMVFKEALKQARKLQNRIKLDYHL